MNSASITEYCVSSIDKISEHLLQGFELYGSPFLSHDDVVYQALIKRKNAPNNNSIGALNIPHPSDDFSMIERRCIEGLLADLSYMEIAQQVHRSPRTVRNIIGQLRQTWKCQTNVGFILALQKNNVI